MNDVYNRTLVLWLDDPSLANEEQLPEYYRRELGLTPVTTAEVRRRCLASASSPLLAHVYVNPDSLRHLEDLPARSIRLFVSADETYRPDLANAICRTPAIREVVRNYPLYPDRKGWALRSLRIAAREVRATGPSVSIEATRALLAGLVIVHRVRHSRRILTRSGITVAGLPLGYTDWFVRGLELVANEGRLGPLPTQGSLIPYLSEQRDVIRDNKGPTVGFVGQLGNFQRKAALRAARRHGCQNLTVRDAFAGGSVSRDEAAFTYVDSLLRNAFVLSPPGNYSGESFRLTETSLLFGVPVATSLTLSDPLRPPLGELGVDAVLGSTWDDAIGKALSMSPLWTSLVSERAFSSASAAILRARQILGGGTRL